MRRTLWASALWLGIPSIAHAADIIIDVVDGPGEGFNDPAAPHADSTAGGNDGATLGEQRLIAFQAAAQIWADRLDSDVDIVVEAEMDVLQCNSGGAVLGSAAPVYFFHSFATSRWYPSALANARVGYDLSPDDADIVAYFSQNLDTDNCLGSSRWYYGLDGEPPSGQLDFLSVVLHELAHGLGVSSMMDYATGQFLGNNGSPDGYSAQVYDLNAGARWPDMTAMQRAASVDVPRGLAWDGPAVTAAAPSVLASGSPQVVTTPNVPGFSAAISETNFGPTVLQQSAEGPLVEVDNSCNLPADLTGQVVLLRFSGCLGVDVAEQRGAVGALIDTGEATEPPGDLDLATNVDVGIPTLHLATGDADALATALQNQSVSVAISASTSLVGAESGGRVLINATTPISTGSSISHWDSLTRRTSTLDGFNRDLLMEPAGDVAGSQVDLTEQMLEDIGWGPVVCGDGVIAGGEVCDDGGDNSNTEADACRTTCQVAGCGDGVVDSGEECDLATDNGVLGSGCTAECLEPACGNGTLDMSEECDDGADNSDTLPDTCRMDCTLPSCGDGVADSAEECDLGPSNGVPGTGCLMGCTVPTCGDGIQSQGEACDDGEDNSDTESDACRSGCSLPSCGDAVVDSGESCDDGTDNSDSQSDACRTDCTEAQCGDGVVDTDEECDEGSANGSPQAECSDDCRAPRCGDGVQNAGEACDDGSLNADAPNACRTDCSLPRCGDGLIDDGEECDDGNDVPLDGCSPSCETDATITPDGSTQQPQPTPSVTAPTLPSTTTTPDPDVATPAPSNDEMETDAADDPPGDGNGDTAMADESDAAEGDSPTTPNPVEPGPDAGDPLMPLTRDGAGDSDDDGCGCRTVGRRSGGTAWWAALLAAVAFIRRRAQRA